MCPKIYYPHEYILVPASSPYPEDTFYKVSLGQQRFRDSFHNVLKIEMIYSDRIGAGGKVNPAFPCSTEDFKKVMEAANKLLRK
ncbi:hypothetical protein BEH_25000 (plasmid) [Priestia filamentosa]|uniref:Uncharacterized protein n=1 Tax=Priestia filamentosa TaxID=1402861 RepID=A0A2S1LZK4_9BACI|nr:hypothetical protein [Priestia filamentosa]AWG44250.1 hypothetical protein BEH_25000 [Priestia filamentosa]